MSQAHGVGPNSLPVLHSDGLKMKALSESCKQDQRLGTPMQYLAVWLFLMSPLLQAQSLQDSDLDGTSDDIEAADPELNPNDPDIFLPRLLKYLSFDNLEEGPGQIVDPDRLREGHQFSAIHFGKGQEPGLELPLVEKDALTFNPPRQGTIRFWYQPTWTSLALLGEGPQEFGHFLEWVLPESTSSSGRWSLQVNPFMDLVQLQYQGSQSANEPWLLNAPIAFEAGTWYQIALTYDTEWIQIHIDGELRASQVNPGFLAHDSGFAQGKLWIGNSATGDRSVQGNIDDMEVFNFAM
ncbi:MAG: LamG domain-containing protein, partial [Verrucomicrobia bacterium]|nr:LamG domain-containing protein [Verrucomicrobiota bacterium]